MNPDKKRYIEVEGESGLSYLGRVSKDFDPNATDELFRTHAVESKNKQTDGTYHPDAQQSA